jgi:hypothetical protein
MTKKNSFHVLRVKLWQELPNCETQDGEWRGEIRQLETGKTSYFRNLEGFREGVRKLGITEEGWANYDD